MGRFSDDLRKKFQSKKIMNGRTFFDEDHKLERLTQLNDPLIKLDQVIDWEKFRPSIESAFPLSDKAKGGRPPFDRLMMFKVLVLQEYYGLSDDKTEFHITDRLSFMRFLKLELSDRVPDSKTIWLYRETLTKKGVIDNLFVEFNKRLRAAGMIAEKGSIVDANIVKAPIQRNSKEENDQIKNGDTPEDWSENKKRQKDTDATWLRKNGKNFYGYKNHVKIDQVSKLITDFETTPASTHDSEVLLELLDETDHGKPLWADAAYPGKETEKELRKRKIKIKLHRKAYKNKPLSKYQQKMNKQKSKIRCRVEHVFGSMKTVFGDIKVTRIGLVRATAQITLKNIIYNMCRLSFLTRSQGISVSI